MIVELPSVIAVSISASTICITGVSLIGLIVRVKVSSSIRIGDPLSVTVTFILALPFQSCELLRFNVVPDVTDTETKLEFVRTSAVYMRECPSSSVPESVIEEGVSSSIDRAPILVNTGASLTSIMVIVKASS